MAIDQSARYVDLGMNEDELMREGNHLLAAYRLKPKPGYGFTATAAHVAAESSTGTNVEVKTTDDFTKKIDAKVYFIDENYFGEDGGLIKIAYPYDLFDHNITDGRLIVANVMTLIIGNNQGMGDIIGLRMLDFWVPPRMLALFDGPSTTIHDIWRAMGRDHENGGAIVGTIIKPKLGLRPQPFADACYEFWLGGDFIKNDEPQGNQPFCPLKKVIPLVADAMKRAQDETGEPKIFSANITADDPFEMIARGEYILETFGEDANRVLFLVDGFVAGVTAVSLARRYFPNTYLHYHRAGHGAVTSSVNPRGYPPLVHCKLARLAGASGIHTGTMGFGKMEGSPDERIVEYMIRNEEADGPFFRQKWYGMKPTAAHISGGMNAIRIPAFCDNLGHDSFCLTAGGGAFGHLDGGTAGAISLRQAFEAWRQGVDLVEYAKEHRELARAFESFPHDADQYYPGWRQRLGIAA